MSSLLSRPLIRAVRTPRRRSRPACSRAVVLALSLAVLSVSGAAAQRLPTPLDAPAPTPRLIFDIEDGLEGVRDRLAAFDPRHLEPAMDLLGLDEPGPPIRVQVVSEGSPEARRAPAWAVAYAIGAAGYVVLIPARVPVYPDGDLVGVLRHEIIHVLVARAAGRYGVPRWFNEGIAVIAAREWQLGDSGRAVVAAFRRSATSMSEVERGFSGGQHTAARAYAVSAAFVRWLLDEEGKRVVARILDHVAEGQTFRTAVRSATQRSLVDLEREFWSDFDFWHRWVPILGSSTTLWIAISMLAVVAFRRRRQKDEEILERWDEEDRRAAELEAWRAGEAERTASSTDEPPGGWVH
ncbi:MAG: hypothetical protein AAGE94_23710 [Acidobacteriota bacterium]